MNEPEEYERIGRTFTAAYHGVCTIDPDHKIRRGDTVSRVQLIRNPLLPVTGVACSTCIRLIEHA